MVMLGNLSISEIEKRLGITFPKETKDFMKSTYSLDADVKHGTWHCFDIPFVLYCGDYETAKTIYEGLKPLHDQCKEKLTFTVKE